MKTPRAASRYAKAILSLAIEQNIATPVNEDMKGIMVTVAKNNELQDFLTSPLVPSTNKLETLKLIFKDVQELTFKAFELLVTNKRVNILADVAAQYIVLFEGMNKRVIAIVTTAVPLDKALEVKILEKATALAGKEVTLQKIVDPSIIGGFILRVGDQEINASVQSKFNGLKRAFAQ